MSIIKCPECNREVSDTLKSCPHCGFKFKKVKGKKKREKKKIRIGKKEIAIIVSAGVICIAAVFACSLMLLSETDKAEISTIEEKIGELVAYKYYGTTKSQLENHRLECVNLEEAYKSLKWKQRIRVDGYKELEAELVEVTDEITKRQNKTIQQLIDDIDSFGEVSVNSLTKIDRLKEIYNSLSGDEKKKVSNAAKINELETKYHECLINEVVELINNIGPVKTVSGVEDEIEYAKKAYNELSDADKAKVANYSVLEKKTAELDQLSDKVTIFLNGKKEISKGNLNSARKQLKKLPKNFLYEGTKVSKLLKLLDSKKKWVSLCGRWTTTSGKMEITQQSKEYDSSDGWYRDFEKGESSLDVRCKLSDNGSVTVKIEGSIPVYTEYSPVREGVEQGNIYIRKSKKMSGMGTIRVDKNTTLTISSSGITVRYYNVSKNEDVYFDYIYKTNMSLKKKKESY